MEEYIWTHHARQRIGDRKIPREYIDAVLQKPDHVRQRADAYEMKKKIDDRTYTFLVKKNDRNENLIISCWVDPPFPGTKDAKHKARYKEKQKASPLKKLWLTVLDQLGL